MAVGNAALGDSRVEKAAITARESGYKVTVLAVRRANTQPLGFIDGDIPVLRLNKGRQHYTVKLQDKARPVQGEVRVAFDAIAKQNQVVASLKSALETDTKKSLSSRILLNGKLRKASTKLRQLNDAAESLIDSETQKMLDCYPCDSQWQETWPEIADYRDLFYAGFVQLEPDLIHVHDIHPMAGAEAYSADMAARGGSVEWVYDAHEWLPGQDFYKLPPARHLGWSKMERALAPKASKVLTVSEYMAEQLQERLQLAELPGVVYNAPMLSRRETALGSRRPIREECGLSEDVPLMVYVGGVNLRRGTVTMVDAVAQHPSLHAAFVANKDIVSRTAIRKRAQELGVVDRVHILEYVPADSVSSYIKSADVGVSALLPTAAHHQAAPTKVREYMLAELPVVVSDMKVQEELVRTLGIGEIFPAGNAVALAAAVEKCIVNREHYTSRYTDKLLSENSWDACVPALESAWKASAGSCPNPLTRKTEKPKIYVDIREDGPYGSLISQLQSYDDYEFIQSTRPLQINVESEASEDFYSTPAANRVIDIWGKGFAHLHGIISDSFEVTKPNWLIADINHSLRRIGVRNIQLKVNDDGDDFNYLQRSFPNHYVHDYSPSEFSYRRMLHREHRMADLKTQRYIASPSPLTARSYRKRGLQVPFPITNISPRIMDRSRITQISVGILPASRSKEDEASIQEALDYRGPEFKASLIEPEFDPVQFSEFDIVIDSLGVDYHGYLGALAMGQGVAILTGRHASKAYEHQLKTLPSIRARPGELTELLIQLRREKVDSYRHQALRFAQENYSPASVAELLLRLVNEKTAYGS